MIYVLRLMGNSLDSIHGVGLGLPVVQETVKRMGGTLQVESKVGKGTTYLFLLPFHIDQNPPAEQSNEKNVSLKVARALVVEDNELNMEVTRFYLEQEEMEVFAAVNGKEAVDLFENSVDGYYDVILMDMMMPVMDGTRATHLIRSLNRPDAKTVPIIAMSANTYQKDIEEGMKAGLNEYLMKPVDRSKLLDTIKKYMRKRDETKGS